MVMWLPLLLRVLKTWVSYLLLVLCRISSLPTGKFCGTGQLTMHRINLTIYVITVGIAEVENRTNGVRFPARVRYLSLLQRVQAVYEVHPRTYQMGPGALFPGDRAAGA